MCVGTHTLPGELDLRFNQDEKPWNDDIVKDNAFATAEDLSCGRAGQSHQATSDRLRFFTVHGFPGAMHMTGVCTVGIRVLVNKPIMVRSCSCWTHACSTSTRDR